jgi:PAS domain S-box-containing protein
MNRSVMNYIRLPYYRMILLGFIPICLSAHVNGEHKIQVPNILMINSYHYGYRQSDKVTRTEFQKLHEAFPHVMIHLEYMDTKRYHKDDDLELINRFLIDKYSQQPIDLILTSDDYAFQFVKKWQKQTGSRIPVVFSGLNYFEPVMIEDFPNFTGIIEKGDILENIRVMERLHPEADTLVIINDHSLTGLALKTGEGRLIENNSRFSVRYLEGDRLSFEELLGKLSLLTFDTIVLYQGWLQDRTNQIYSHEEVLPVISEHSSVPVYGFSEIYLGLGIVGGKLLSGREQGLVAADMAIRILNGENPHDIPVQLDSHCVYKYDFRQLQRFGISMNALPRESVIINRPVTFFDKHRSVILAALVVLLIQTLLIIYLLLNRMWRLKVENAFRNEHRLLLALMDNMPDFIYFKDKFSRFIRNNRAHLALFGLKKQEETLGKTNFDFFPLHFAEETLEDEKRIIETGKPLINKIENISDIKGQPAWVSTTKVPVLDEQGKVTTIIGISRDITERILSAEKVQSSLEEKELLLKEIHHRVKNNLQVISSLLNLQSSAIKDPKILAVLKESQDRVRSMALIHENLYRSSDISHLDVADYIKTLVSGLKRGYVNDRQDVKLDLQIEQIPLDIDLAVPCGLIINELVSNALKHAFPDGRPDPKIRIEFKMLDQKNVHLSIEDNGVGLPEHFEFNTVDSLGLKLIRILVRDQLEGNIAFSLKQGTRIDINFPLIHESNIA